MAQGISLGLQLPGAVGALEQLLQQRKAEQLAAEEREKAARQQEIENTIRQRAATVQEGQLGVQQGQLGLGRDRFAGEQAADAAKASAGAAQAEELKGFIPTLPAHVQPQAQLRRLGVELPPSAFEAPATPQGEVKDVGGFIYERKPGEGGFLRTGSSRNMSAEAASTARAAEKPAGPSPYAQERAARTRQSVLEIKSFVDEQGRSAVGGISSALAYLPESKARFLRGQLDTLKANIGFNELAQMREASKTGGALGQVAVRELDFLQSTLGSLDPNMSPAQLQTQLDKVDQSVARWEAAQTGGRTDGTGSPDASSTPDSQEFDYVNGKLVPR